MEEEEEAQEGEELPVSVPVPVKQYVLLAQGLMFATEAGMGHAGVDVDVGQKEDASRKVAAAVLQSFLSFD